MPARELKDESPGIKKDRYGERKYLRTLGKCELVTLMSARSSKTSSVTKLSLKTAQKGLKSRNSKKLELPLSDGWQRDLVGFCVR